jgi:hypothetical protein
MLGSCFRLPTKILCHLRFDSALDEGVESMLVGHLTMDMHALSRRSPEFYRGTKADVRFIIR